MQLTGLGEVASGATTVVGYSRLWAGILDWTRDLMDLEVAELLTLASGSTSACLPLQDSKTENLDRAHSMDLPKLEAATTYCARVRVKPISDYYGLWSEWSNEYTWTTDWGMSLCHHHTPGQPHCTGQGRLESHSTLCAFLGNGTWHITRTVNGDLGNRGAEA